MKKDVIIVTGAASGVGRETALLLAKDGAKVVCADIDEEGLRELTETMRKRNLDAKTKVTDVGKPEEVEELVDFTVDTYKRLDGIFNNAGIRDGTHFDDVDPVRYHEHLATNQHSVFYGMHYAAKKMQELNTKNGRIVNTASIRSYFGAKKSFRYSAAKAAIVSMTMSAADALAKDGIRVNAVAPAFIDTGLLASVPQERRERLEKKHLRGRLLKAVEVAKVVRFLFSEDSIAVNGATLLVDDGFLAVH